MMTIRVSFIVSSRVGQVTFLSSAITSLKKLTGGRLEAFGVIAAMLVP